MVPSYASNLKLIGLTVLEILPLYDFGILAGKCLFGPILAVLGDFDPWNCDIVVLTHEEMQYFQKHVFWDIKRQNRSSGLTPSRAEEQINKKAQTINISSLRGGHAPEPIDMPFGVLSGVPDLITHTKLCVNRLRGFSASTPRKVPFPILFWTTLTTVLHYRADCDEILQEETIFITLPCGLTDRQTHIRDFSNSTLWQLVLNVDRSTVKHALQTTQNDCHWYLSYSFRMHQILFRPGLYRAPGCGSLQRSSGRRWFKGGDCFEGEWEVRRGKGGGTWPLTQIFGSAAAFNKIQCTKTVVETLWCQVLLGLLGQYKQQSDDKLCNSSSVTADVIWLSSGYWNGCLKSNTCEVGVD